MRQFTFCFFFCDCSPAHDISQKICGISHLLPNINTGNPDGICLHIRATSRVKWEITMYEVNE